MEKRWLVRLAVILCAAATAGSISAQEYELFGSVEGFVGAHVLQDSEAGVILSGHAEIALHHRLSYESAEGVLSHRLAALPEGRVSQTVDEAYLALYPAPAVTFFAGRQRLDWGAAYFISPSDALHPQPGPADAGQAGRWPAADAERGFLGLAGILTFGANGTLSLALSGEDALAMVDGSGAVDDGITDASDSTAEEGTEAGILETPPWELARFAAATSLFLAPVDVAVTMVYGYERAFRPGASLSVGAGPMLLFAEAAVELHNDRMYPVASPLPSFESPDLWEPYFLFAAGAEVPIAAGPVSGSLIAEYQYNGLGYSEEELDLLASSLGPTAGTNDAGVLNDPRLDLLPRLFRFHYLIATARLDVGGYAAVDVGSVVALESGAGAVQAGITVTSIPGVDLWFDGTVVFGADDSEFALIPEDSFPGRLVFRAGSTLHF